MKFFCPSCFAFVLEKTVTCPNCHTVLQEWDKQHNYFEKLIKALEHPLSEVRMAAVAALTEFRSSTAALPAVLCALKRPEDIELLKSVILLLNQLPECNDKNVALERLSRHPSFLINRINRSDKVLIQRNQKA